MIAHCLQRQNKPERTAWRHSVATLVAKLNDPSLIAAVLFCLIALLVTALRWELQRATPARPGGALLCSVHTCFAF
jgi:uncharacterized membrane protein